MPVSIQIVPAGGPVPAGTPAPAAPATVPGIRKTKFYRRFNRRNPDRPGPRECWEAETTDGVWRFIRLEEPGTPWAIVHIETGIEVDWAGSLDRGKSPCTRYVANGWAQERLDRIQAHQRGAHDAERDPMCGKC